MGWSSTMGGGAKTRWLRGAGRRGGGEGRPPVGFGVLHAGNTMLNMGFTLLQLLVLAHILPLDRYSEVVFLTSIGFYVQPIDQALGKANFVALRAIVGQGAATAGRREVLAALWGQAVLLIAVSLAVPSLLAPLGSQRWIEDVLFLALSLATNYWAFDLQSTAWAIDRNLPFVKLAMAHRVAHFGALALAAVSGSFLLFGIAASGATLVAMSIVARMFARAGVFQTTARLADWPDYARIFGVSLLATITDLLVLNAPYGLIAARFGIGPMLVVFDSIMKVARIAMAGARTLAEIALSRHSTFVAAGRSREARGLFLLVVGACLGATFVPALVVALAGPTVFRLLLGANNVIPPAAMMPAALVIMASALYQPAVFFLGYSNQRKPVQTLALCAAAVLALFALGLFLVPMQPALMLGVFGLCFAGIGVLALFLTNRLFGEPAPRSRSLEAATLAEAAIAAEPSA